jgi:hypothetical protein
MVEYGKARGEVGTDIPPEHVAPLVTYLMSDDARGITGQVIRLDGAQLSLLARPGERRTSVERADWDHQALRESLPQLIEQHQRG